MRASLERFKNEMRKGTESRRKRRLIRAWRLSASLRGHVPAGTAVAVIRAIRDQRGTSNTSIERPQRDASAD